jgi:hypothetical protein
MRRFLLLTGAIVALTLPATAVAKGPSEATITGPGLGFSLTLRGGGEGGNTGLGLLVVQGGFFAQVYGQYPDPTLRSRPENLGPRYTVAYTVPGPSTDTLRQDLYPYAPGGAVTHMAAGQTFWGNQSTHGGWYRGSPALKAMLMRAGLPQTRTGTRRATSRSHTKSIAIGAGAGIALAAVGLMILRRRR